jgi:D-psicose/D-tagatose/L-ribulose 3-epimerase
MAGRRTRSTGVIPLRRREFLQISAAAALAGGARNAFARATPAPLVQIGACADTDQLEALDRMGYDYIEPPAAKIAALDETAFQALKTRVDASRIKCRSFNILMPRGLRIVGKDVSETTVYSYLEPALDRCRQLGATVAVWGSAGSRNVPPGFSRDKAWTQIQDFLRLAGGIAKPMGLVIAIEPLRRAESNIINTGAEALRLVHEVNHPAVKMIIDYYHLREENESPEILVKARKQIVHFHFANPHGRLWPKSPDEDPVYAQFFALVKRIKFRGGISVEGRGSVERDGAATLAFFKRELA